MQEVQLITEDYNIISIVEALLNLVLCLQLFLKAEFIITETVGMLEL